MPEPSDERIWEAFLRELAWLHAQMNRALRESFGPLFGLFEIKTIVLCLRNRAIGRTDRIESLLHRSLLADDLKEIILRGSDVRTTISAAFPELEPVYGEGSLPAFENELMRLYLQSITAKRHEPAIAGFFRVFVDMRNLVLLYKRLRWRLEEPCAFIRGGSIEVAQLEAIAGRDDNAAFEAMLQRAGGLDTFSVAASEGALETLLLRSMTRPLMKSSHTDDDLALVVAYVWRLYVQARNLAVIHHGAGLEPPVLERELIL